MSFDVKAYVRSLGYGAELSEFPIKIGQQVVTDDPSYVNARAIL